MKPLSVFPEIYIYLYIFLCFYNINLNKDSLIGKLIGILNTSVVEGNTYVFVNKLKTRATSELFS